MAALDEEPCVQQVTELVKRLTTELVKDVDVPADIHLATFEAMVALILGKALGDSIARNAFSQSTVDTFVQSTKIASFSFDAIMPQISRRIGKSGARMLAENVGLNKKDMH